MEATLAFNPLRKFPIGIQSFEFLREQGYLYVDKTDLVYQLVKMGKPYFLSRPRRFGKSLLLSTLEAYFKGKKDLFKGLAIEHMEKDWIEYPVLHLDLNAEKYDSRERQLAQWETLYETGGEGITYSGRFMAVIRHAYEKTGHRVVVLIDEYDKPLLRSFHDENLQQDFRETLTAFYTALKSADPWLQFVFITGVTKFAQMGIFSNLNQLNDISFNHRYASLCGMTRKEIAGNFAPELENMGIAARFTSQEILDVLARQYDGYRFTEDQTEGFFNPFSVLSSLSEGKLRNYWFATGTPTFLIEILKQTRYDLRELDGIEVTAASLSDDRVDIYNPIPMIYQSGYLTIKSYDECFRFYTLGFPNEEVKYGFLNFATPFYTTVSENDAPFYIGRFIQDLENRDIESFLIRLRAFFADFPYELNDKTERHYQVVFYLVFKLMGQYVEAEVRSVRGRADAVVKTKDAIYVFEFKLGGSVSEALSQIDDKGYLIPYTANGKRLYKVGGNFDAVQRNLGEWKSMSK